MHITLERSGAIPLYHQLALEIQRRIRSGALPAGTQLPTIRALAQQLGVTRLTIHAAYNELQSGGWIEATVGRGTFVADAMRAPVSTVEPGRELSAGGMLSDMLRMSHLPGIRSLAMADAAQEFYPQREFGRAMQEALESGPSVLGYASPQGDPVLRRVLADLLVERGLSSTPDELLITSGVTQGLALVAQTLAQPGDCVIVEQPTYMGALSIFGARGLRLIEAPVDQYGLVTDGLEELITTHRPRFIYVIPAFHNPTGVSMHPERRAALAAIAARYQLPIVEDDIYAQLAYEGSAPAPLAAHDPHGLVLHVGSFSKMLLPGVRIGYIATDHHWIGRLTSSKQVADLCSPAILQRAMAIFIQRGWLHSHLRRVLPHYRERRDALLTALVRYFPSGARWNEPRGGFSVWVKLPPGISTTDLYLAAIERGAAFVPGDVFYASGRAPQPSMRLAFSLCSPEVITEAVRIFGDLLNTHAVRLTRTREIPNDYVPIV